MAAHALTFKFPRCSLVVELAALPAPPRRRLHGQHCEDSQDGGREALLGHERPVHGRSDQYMAGAYLRFFEGFNSSLAFSSDVDRRYLAAASGFATSSGSASPAGGAVGGGEAGGAGSRGAAAAGGVFPGRRHVRGGGGGSAQGGAGTIGGTVRVTSPQVQGTGCSVETTSTGPTATGLTFVCLWGAHPMLSSDSRGRYWRGWTSTLLHLLDLQGEGSALQKGSALSCGAITAPRPQGTTRTAPGSCLNGAAILLSRLYGQCTKGAGLGCL